MYPSAEGKVIHNQRSITEDQMSVISVSGRMKRHCCVQVWRMKLVLSVAVVLFTGSETKGMSTANGIEIRDITGNHKQFSGKFPDTDM
jgi:hypothetical protein